MSYSKIILQYLKSINDWIPGYKLQSVNTPYGWIGSSGLRRCRELAKEGKILRRINGKYVEYKYKPETVQQKLFNSLYI